MEEEFQEAICTACEWTGDGAGLSVCPACGSEITLLSEIADEDAIDDEDEEYPKEVLKKGKEDIVDEVMAEEEV